MNIENKIIKIFSKNNKYIGDDCAYLKETRQLISTDTIIENVHFDFHKFTPKQIAHRAFISNISDIQSSGGIPKYILLNISFPKSKYKYAIQISKHIKTISKKYNIKVIGGDTTSSECFFLSISIISKPIEKNKVLTRSKAKVGDSIFIFNNLGYSKLGFLNLYKNLKLPKRLKVKSRKQFLKPNIYLYSDIFKKLDINSCTDLSDSLFDSLKIMSKQSKKKFIIDNLDEINPSLIKFYNDNKMNYYNTILSSGEEYIPVFTMNFDKLTKKILNILENRGIKIIKIGKVSIGSGVSLKNINFKRTYLFSHFKNNHSKQ